MKIIYDLRLLLLGLWLGAAIFFSAVVAPGAFKVLRSYQILNAGEIAGAIVNRSLMFINLSGFIIGILLLITGIALFRREALRSFALEISLVTILVVATAVGHWIIAAKLHALRLSFVVPVDQIQVDDPRRISFDALHAYSVKALGIAMIAAIAYFVLITLRGRRAS